MPAPDYRKWKIIGHNGVAKAGCCITQPVMDRGDGTITLLSLGPYGGLTRDLRANVEDYAAQGLLTLFPDDCDIILPPESEDQQEVYPIVLSISKEFKDEIVDAPGDLPRLEEINWKHFREPNRWIACLATSMVETLRERWGGGLCSRFDWVFMRESRDWDRLERIAGFGLEIARAKGLRENLYRRYCMAMLVRDDGPLPERAKRIFDAFVISEFRTLNWTSYKSDIQGLHEDLLTRRRRYYLSQNAEKALLEILRTRSNVASGASNADAPHRNRAARAIALNGKYQLENVEAVRPI